MKAKEDNRNMPVDQAGNQEKMDLLGYMIYHASENPYSNYQNGKTLNTKDIPWSESDEIQENFGSEDEENDFYNWAPGK